MSRALQKAVAVMLFTSVLVVASLSMYKSGKLTSNKMQLQNAADAAAYSMALVEARDMNYAAYMNRAIVANEVAIGQMVGLASWANHFKSFADYMDSYNLYFLAPATLGASTAVITPVTTVWRTAGTTAYNVMAKIANFGTIVLHNINKFYGLSEYGYHTVSIILAVGTLDEMLDQNGPPGTKISDFGIVSLIAHVATYGVLPNLPGDQFSTAYSPTATGPYEEFAEGGYGRLSGLIRDGRDPFTKGRGWELRPPGFPIDFDVTQTFGIDIGVASVEFGFQIEFHFDLSLERKGASELRIVLPASGDVSGKNFNWSSADTTGLFIELATAMRLWAEACVVIVGCASVGIGGGFDVSNSQVTVYVEIMGDRITLLDGIPFPTSAPFASAFTEAGKTSPNNLGLTTMNLSSLGGVIDTEHYGEAANNLAAWVSPGPGGPTFPLGVQFGSDRPYDSLNRVNKSYAGLPHYVDSNYPHESFMGIGAPNLIIGLVQDEADFDKKPDVSGCCYGTDWSFSDYRGPCRWGIRRHRQI